MSRRSSRERALSPLNIAADGIEADGRATGPRRRRVLVGVGLVLVLGVAIATGVVVKGRRDHFELPDAATVAIPDPPEDLEPARAYFLGPGSALPTLIRLDPITSGHESPPAGRCGEVAVSLDPFGSPSELRGVAEAVPDQVTADMAVNYVDSLIGVVAACGAGVTPPTEDLAFAATVLARRLDQLGVS